MTQLHSTGLQIAIHQGNALDFHADVLALKHAHRLYGLDARVVHHLDSHGVELRNRLPESGEALLAKTDGAIAAQHVLFLGVGNLYLFNYDAIRDFGSSILESLADQLPQARHIALTIHGPGYGLDEEEAFMSLIMGLLDAYRDGNAPPHLEQVTIVEMSPRRAERLSKVLADLFPRLLISQEGLAKGGPEPALPDRLRSAGIDSHQKPHIFVAMPFDSSMDDVYHYGIQGAVRSSGFLCERADLSTFTGDVLRWVKQRIETASLVVADLSTANPNVYLEVGFAWGCGRPTVLVVNEASDLKFDVKGQRCLVYQRIKDLEEKLRNELTALRGQLGRDGTQAARSQ